MAMALVVFLVFVKIGSYTLVDIVKCLTNHVLYILIGHRCLIGHHYETIYLTQQLKSSSVIHFI